MKTKATLDTLIAALPVEGVQPIDASDMQDLLANISEGIHKSKSATATITSNVLDFNQSTSHNFVDTMNVAGGGANITSATNLDKASVRGVIANSGGSGNVTLTVGNNIKATGGANVVLAPTEYCKYYTDNTTLFIESVHKWA